MQVLDDSDSDLTIYLNEKTDDCLSTKTGTKTMQGPGKSLPTKDNFKLGNATCYLSASNLAQLDRVLFAQD